MKKYEIYRGLEKSIDYFGVAFEATAYFPRIFESLILNEKSAIIIS